METSTSEPKHLRVVSLITTNFKRIRAARVDPDPSQNVILIGGANDNGKSSLLDSMFAVFGGKNASPETPVRKGMKKGSVVIDLGEFTATLRFTAAGGRELIVEDKEGTPQKSPQALMDKLTGTFGFDAEAFLRRDPKDQLEILRKIVGIDFAPLDAKKATLYSQRTGANSVVKTLETQLASAPNPTDAPEALVDTAEVVKEIGEVSRHNEGRLPLVQAFNDARNELAEAQRIEELARKTERDVLAQIDSLEKELNGLRETAQAANRSIVGAAELTGLAAKAVGLAEANGKAFVPKDAAALQTKLAGAEAANSKFRQAEARKKLLADLKTATATATNLDNAVQEIDGQKEKMLLEAKFPVAGLALGENGITYDGLPFSQASSSVKRRVSVAIGAALNPTLRVTIVKDGSLLDAAAMDQLKALAAEHDLQVWVEVVTRDEEDKKRCTVVIHDGLVEGAAPPEDVSVPEATAAPADTSPEPPKDLFGGLPPQ